MRYFLLNPVAHFSILDSSSTVRIGNWFFLWGVEDHQSIVSRPLASATYQRDYGGKRWLANPTSDSGPDYWLQCCGAGRAELIFETWSRSQNYFFLKYLLQSVLRMLHRMKKSSIETYLFVLLLLYRFKAIYGRSWSLSRNYGQRWSRKEPEPIINNFGSATLPYWKFQTWLLFNVIIIYKSMLRAESTF